MSPSLTQKSILSIPKLIATLSASYPQARTSLRFTNPLELLVATILSAQCTDKRVNQVTEVLFKKYRSAKDYAEAKIEELEKDIRSTGFFRQKAKNIKAAARVIVDRFAGQVPNTMDGLLQLPGVARKTANVVLGNGFGQSAGIAVDTHVSRVSQRLGLTKQKTPEKIELDLMTLIPQGYWTYFSNALIQHGRHICQARRPLCQRCPLRKICPSAKLVRL